MAFRSYVLLWSTVLWFPSSADVGAFDELRLDFGPAESAVGDGWLRLTVADGYDARRGFGWERPPESAFSRDRHWPGELPSWHSRMRDLPLDPVTRDGVASSKTVVLRMDVPDGKYTVRVWLGDYIEPTRQQRVEVNGQPIASGVDAGTGGIWGQILRAAVRPVRGIAMAEDGMLRVQLSADGRNTVRATAIQVRRLVPAPVRLEGTRFQWTGPPDDDATAVCRRLNHAKLSEARQRIDAMPTDRRYAKACLLEALAGHLDRNEPRACLETVEQASALLKEPVEDVDPMALAERRQELQDFRTALEYRLMMRYERSYELTHKSSYRRYREAIALAEQTLPDEPLYWQAQLLRARLLFWLGREGDPGAAAEARPIIDNLFKQFPDNRIVRIYAGQPVAPFKEYSLHIPGAPRWAAVQRPARNGSWNRCTPR